MDTIYLTLYVPHPTSRLRRWIDAGSAIVGKREGERISIYYEGDRYGFHRGDFDTMVLHAADRLVMSYPTVARAWVLPEELVTVGYVETATRKVSSLTDPSSLQAWRSSVPSI